MTQRLRNRYSVCQDRPWPRSILNRKSIQGPEKPLVHNSYEPDVAKSPNRHLVTKINLGLEASGIYIISHNSQQENLKLNLKQKNLVSVTKWAIRFSLISIKDISRLAKLNAALIFPQGRRTWARHFKDFKHFILPANQPSIK